MGARRSGTEVATPHLTLALTPPRRALEGLYAATLPGSGKAAGGNRPWIFLDLQVWGTAGGREKRWPAGKSQCRGARLGGRGWGQARWSGDEGQGLCAIDVWAGAEKG